jgi:hypothetical protein
VTRNCDSCGVEYEAVRRTSRYCSPLCRTRAHRGHVARSAKAPRALKVAADAPDGVSEPVEGPYGRLAAATRAELAAVGRETTPAGVAALLLAERIDSGQGTESGMASLSKEWRATMGVALADAHKAESQLDKLRKLRVDRLGA